MTAAVRKLLAAAFLWYILSPCVCGHLCAQAPDVKVRIYSLESLQQLAISPVDGVSWKTCPTCRIHELTSQMTLHSAGNRLQFGKLTLKKAYLNGRYRVQVPGEHPLESRIPLAITAEKGGLILIMSMQIEDYVAAVLAGESANVQSDEALKAMAVAVRSYAVHFRGRHQAEHFDFCDTTHCQDFRLSAVNDRQRAAVDATEGELLWSRGSTAATYYHQNCGGTAAAADEVWPGVKADYLPVHADTYCLRSEHARWESRISNTDLRSALVKAGVQVPAEWKALQVESRSGSGRVRLLKIMGRDGWQEMKLSASTLRFAVGRDLGWNQIKSDFYDLRDTGDEVLFSGRGSGHGVGLCQEGADSMGKQGKSYRDILAFYYPGTELGVSAQGLSWHRLHSEQLDVLIASESTNTGLLETAQQELNKVELSSGLQFKAHLLLKIYPTLASYRDSTGEPGWVAASTRGNTIRLQPAELLRQKGTLESTLRHELFHVLVDDNTRVSLPLWFREGLVLYLAESSRGSADSPVLPINRVEAILHDPQSQEQMRQAYASARATVATLVARRGKAEVLGWLSRGIPAGALASFSTTQAAQH